MGEIGREGGERGREAEVKTIHRVLAYSGVEGTYSSAMNGQWNVPRRLK